MSHHRNRMIEEKQVATPRTTSKFFVIVALAAIVTCAWLATENLRLRTNRGYDAAPEARTEVTLTTGELLPDIAVRNLLAADVAESVPEPLQAILEILEGPPVLFVFTSTCPYCARSVPLTGSLRGGLAQLGIELVGLALDGQLLSSQQDVLPPYRNVAAASLAEAKRLGVNRVPAFLLVDGNGRLLQSWTGQLVEDRVDDIVAAARMGATRQTGN